MAQISRPFQIGLVAVVALAGVWLFALHGHSSSSSSGSSAHAPRLGCGPGKSRGGSNTRLPRRRPRRRTASAPT